jgi:kynureninase
VPASSTQKEIARAVEALGPGPLTEEGAATHLRPLFTKTLAQPGVYLASQSLGRPLDAVERDLAEGVSLWQRSLSGAWDQWLAEEALYRAQLAALLGAERVDSVVPRGSAGQGLRTVLNLLPDGARVLATTGEFASISMLLAQYARVGRIELDLLPPDRASQADGADGQAGAEEADRYDAGTIAEAVRKAAAAGRPVALVVVSQVFFATGQLLGGAAELAAVCHQHGAQLLLDSYHSLGAVPVDVRALHCDYMIGGCYKYLRGGPGAAFLYLAPEVLNRGIQPLDTSWYALEPSASPLEPGWPQLLPGGNALLEGTPSVLTWYQARSGLAFTQAMGIERLRAYGFSQLAALRTLLAERRISSAGGDAEHGAFLTVRATSAEAARTVVDRLGEQEIVVNARGLLVRLCPDCLTTRAELEFVARALGQCREVLAG